MNASWVSAAVFVLLALAVPASMLLGAAVLGVRAKVDSPAKRDTYECGEEIDGAAWVRFHPRYYLVAILFVLFDVEAAFLFPWAVSLREVGGVAIIDMVVFLGILFLGWAYAVRKGALTWQ